MIVIASIHLLPIGPHLTTRVDQALFDTWPGESKLARKLMPCSDLRDSEVIHSAVGESKPKRLLLQGIIQGSSRGCMQMDECWYKTSCEHSEDLGGVSNRRGWIEWIA